MNDLSNVPAIPAPGVYAGIENEAYHAGPGISKSGLWTIYRKSPAHYRYAEREESPAFDFGTACHFAILQPELFEKRVMRGPRDRRGNNWKDVQAEAANSGRLLLIEADYNDALVIRDSLHTDPFLNALIVSPYAQVEHSAFWIDAETGVLCRSRPDLYRADLGVIVDVKSPPAHIRNTSPAASSIMATTRKRPGIRTATLRTACQSTASSSLPGKRSPPS